MSKRRGRKRPLNSEIKSVLRAPREGAEETEAADSAAPSAEAEVTPEAKEAPAAATSVEPRDEASSEPMAPPPGGDAADADSLPLDLLAEVGAEAEAPLADLGAEPTRPASASARSPRLRSVSGRRSASSEEDSEALAEPTAERKWRALDDGDEAEGELERPGRHEAGESTDDESEGPPEDEDYFPPLPLAADGDDTEGFLRGLLEALLFTSQKPMDLKDLARSAGIDKPRARELIDQLAQSYEGRGLCIEEVAGGFVMRSSPRYAPYIQKILAIRPIRLSRAQLETLAIVAYRQPVTKPEVDEIRGVDSGQVIKGLLERSLLKMLGKKDEPGRPTLYGTTNEFLELLNLQSLKDLPTLREYTELSEESQRKFREATGEVAPSDTLTFERPPGDVAPVPLDFDDEPSAATAEAPRDSPTDLAAPEPPGEADPAHGAADEDGAEPHTETASARGAGDDAQESLDDEVSPDEESIAAEPVEASPLEPSDDNRASREE